MSPASDGDTRVAFFGGSFDPPHLGHVAVARAAREALHLDRVLFAPVGLQPLKPTGPSASFEDRVAMTRLAIAGQVGQTGQTEQTEQGGFEVSLADAPKPGSTTPNFTVDTLTSLRESLPQETTLFLLLGADSFRALHHWHRAAELPFLANLIVASRPNENLSDLAASLPPGIALDPINGEPNRYRLINNAGEQSELTILPNLHYDISATQLRNQIHGKAGSKTGRKPLLDPAVLAYIRQHHLYE
jgi:nicotinate-nucleotide adenylyltransferase